MISQLLQRSLLQSAFHENEFLELIGNEARGYAEKLMTGIRKVAIRTVTKENAAKRKSSAREHEHKC